MPFSYVPTLILVFHIALTAYLNTGDCINIMAEGLGQVVSSPSSAHNAQRRTVTLIFEQVSWYICVAFASVFVVARLWVRLATFRKLSVEDGFVILSICCLIADLIIQQLMWSWGMASIPTASRENFIRIMKVGPFPITTYEDTETDRLPKR